MPLRKSLRKKLGKRTFERLGDELLAWCSRRQGIRCQLHLLLGERFQPRIRGWLTHSHLGKAIRLRFSLFDLALPAEKCRAGP